MTRHREFLDLLNARLCEIVAKCAGNKDVTPADFLILRRETENQYDTPAQIAGKLSMLGGG